MPEPVVVFNPSIRHQVGVNSRRAKKGFFHLKAKNLQKALIGQYSYLLNPNVSIVTKHDRDAVAKGNLSIHRF